MQYLKQEGYELTEAYPGIYYISGKTMFDMQIIVSREVEEKEHVWLYSLQRDISWEAYYRLLMSIDELEAKEKEEYGEAVLEVVSRANMEHIEKWKEAEEMCATLEKIMAPELEEKKQEGIWEGRQEGRQEGRREGKVEGMIIAYAELGISVQKIAEKLSLSVEIVEKIVEENAH
jgi:flagellar biosynthesis/type III secretory pathway protein FliH